MPDTRYFLPLVLISLFVSSNAVTQGYESETVLPEEKKFQWPEGKSLAISLTFDDARLSQIDKGIPVLDKYNVKGTFYLSPDAMIKRAEGWKKAVSHSKEWARELDHLRLLDQTQ